MAADAANRGGDEEKGGGGEGVGVVIEGNHTVLVSGESSQYFPRIPGTEPTAVGWRGVACKWPCSLTATNPASGKTPSSSFPEREKKNNKLARESRCASAGDTCCWKSHGQWAAVKSVGYLPPAVAGVFTCSMAEEFGELIAFAVEWR